MKAFPTRSRAGWLPPQWVVGVVLGSALLMCLVSHTGDSLIPVPHPLASHATFGKAYGPQKRLPQSRREWFMEQLAYLNTLEPHAPVNATCQPPPLPSHLSPNLCGAPGLTQPKRRDHYAKIAHMIQFSYEVDTLEIFLQETCPLVELVVLVESTYTHQQHKRKPLVWERVRWQDRFKPFQDCILHVVVDDGDVGPWTKIDKDAQRTSKQKPSDQNWSAERTQNLRGWEGLLNWNKNSATPFGDGDIFISGDADEVMSREALHALHYCDMRFPILTGALWMPMGNLNKAYPSDFALQRHKWSFAMPTIYRFEASENGIVYQHGADRLFCDAKRKGCEHFRVDFDVPGGMHMTRIAYLPHVFIKEEAGTEGEGMRELWYEVAGNVERLREIERGRYTLEDGWYDDQKVIRDRLVDLDTARRFTQNQPDIFYVPWFLECNRERYPYWWGNPDPRVEQMAEMLGAWADIPQQSTTITKKSNKPSIVRTFGWDSEEQHYEKSLSKFRTGFRMHRQIEDPENTASKRHARHVEQVKTHRKHQHDSDIHQ